MPSRTGVAAELAEAIRRAIDSRSSTGIVPRGNAKRSPASLAAAALVRARGL